MRLSKPTFALHRPLRAQLLITAVLIGDLGVSLLVTVNALRLGRAEN